MTREELLKRLDIAAKQDRARLFVITDAMTYQSKYDENRTEIEEVKEYWRNMTEIENYPEIDFPFTLPEFFPEVQFASQWKANYVEVNAKEPQEDGESSEESLATD